MTLQWATVKIWTTFHTLLGLDQSSMRLRILDAEWFLVAGWAVILSTL